MARARGKRFEVGDKAVLPLGRNNPLHGRVIEDRGNLGANGERILRLVIDLGEGARETEWEVPEERLERPNLANRRVRAASS